MKYEIHGTVLQSLDVTLNAGEAVFTERGGMAWMRGDVDMKTGAKGGIMAGLGRALSGESFFMTTYTAKSQQATVTFTPEAIGKVIPFRLEAGQWIICQRDSFMVAEEGVKLSLHFKRKLGAGLFGGEGFILQKIEGPGTAFVEIPGEVREVTLAPGEKMRVDPGHIAVFEPQVGYDIEMVKGVSNILFGGEGLFLATMTGPGRVWLQSMPLANLAASLQKYIIKPG